MYRTLDHGDDFGNKSIMREGKWGLLPLLVSCNAALNTKSFRLCFCSGKLGHVHVTGDTKWCLSACVALNLAVSLHNFARQELFQELTFSESSTCRSGSSEAILNRHYLSSQVATQTVPNNLNGSITARSMNNCSSCINIKNLQIIGALSKNFHMLAVTPTSQFWNDKVWRRDTFLDASWLF